MKKTIDIGRTLGYAIIIVGKGNKEKEVKPMSGKKKKRLHKKLKTVILIATIIQVVVSTISIIVTTIVSLFR